MSADERAISAGPPGGLRLDEDFHVQSTFSDDAVSTVAENVGTARERGLCTLCLAEHVRRDTAWLPEFLGAMSADRQVPGLRVLAGSRRRSWTPPAGSACRPAWATSTAIPMGLSVQDAIERLVRATLRAAVQVQESGLRPLVAHLFSLLPKSGLAEDRVPPSLLGELAAGLAASQAMVEVNEKWRCPSARTIGALLAAGVPIVAGSDSHHCRDIGRYSSVRAAGALRATAPRPACRSTSSAGCSSLWSWPERSLGSVRRTST